MKGEQLQKKFGNHLLYKDVRWYEYGINPFKKATNTKIIALTTIKNY